MHDVTVESFKQYIDLHVKENQSLANVASTAFCDQLDDAEVVECLRYAAKNGIDLELAADAPEYEETPQPDQAERDEFNRNAVLAGASA